MIPQSRIWIFLFFLISGATGLVYEVVWTRLLTLVLGNTHYSVTTVLTAFMAGLALGSYCGGKWIDRRFNPLAVYALLEAAIGIYCVLIPLLIESASPIFKAIYLHPNQSHLQASLIRFLICGSILLIPTTFMGATLPVLSKFVTRDPGFIGRDVGTLYSINTFGAVIGAMAGAFLFMRLWGLQATILIAAACNVGIAVVIYAVFKPNLFLKEAPDPPQAPAAAAGKSVTGNVAFILICFGISGVCALIYQVAWNRILSLLLGSSVYAFSLILTTFILGLALGTVVFARCCQRFTDPLKVFGLLQAGIGFSALLALPWFDEIPFVNRWVYQNWGAEFGSIQLSNFGIIFALLFLPTFFMGAQFPIVVRLVAKDLSTLGQSVGKVYASNTVGTIFGSFLGGFLMIPFLGVQHSILLAVILNVSLGICLLALAPSLKVNLKIYALPVLLVVCLWQARAVDAWDRGVISSGSFMPYRIGDLQDTEQRKNRVLFYQEGIHTTVTTELSISGNIFLRVNGKTNASLALDMRTQLLSGYLPLFFHKNPKTVLVIGQGSGITLGAVEQFPVESIDLVEISFAVIEGSRFFSPFNHDALADARVNLIVEDGRNHVALSDKKYDVIISEPSNPWISGVGVLFTVDFFKLVDRRLNPGGIVCIWVHTNMSPSNFKSITRSFSTVFPHVTMWESIVGDDYLLIGSQTPYGLPYEEVERFLADDTKAKDLQGIGINNIRDLISLMAMSREGLLAFSGEAPLHTDDNSLLEFGAPRYIYRDERDILVRQLTPFIKIDPRLIRFDEADDEKRLRVLQEVASVARSESQVQEIKRKARVEMLLDQAQEVFNRGESLGALALYGEILKIDPQNTMTHLNMGNVYYALSQNESAEAAYKRSLAINPYYIFGNVALARLYVSSGKPQKAVDILKPVLDWYPGDAEVRFYLGLAYAFQKKADRAIEELRKAVALNPRFAPAYYYLGLQYRGRNSSRSRKYLQTFLDLARLEEGNEKMISRAEKLLKKL